MANQYHFTRAFEEIMKEDKFLTGFQIHTFLLVATNEGMVQNVLESKLDSSNAVVSRTIAKLTRHGLSGGDKPGLDLIETEPDPNDRRYRILTLSHKGRALMQRIRKILGDDAAEW